ncbi:hypothetical protein Anacy_3258 [Anabaena cylindrica PCC 7122]|uniref:Uncharacterized protein n=2 Tax=Nostocaceae TaxID=1162 RepID=K9ZK11_ANACC|nr:hypothetical protein [Anabaena sp. CCAP 1446/1C]AFZ58665.1 hypothetical protein Anacy_3258 [Anabaena cylindrica PCC 7122]BAY04326.1 hypothetical protein NIES19_35890 [Anabaena cylindrica PCC 7122]
MIYIQQRGNTVMQLINRIFTQHSTQASTPANQTSFQSNNIYTLEDLVQTLEEAANYLAAFS